MSEQVDIYNQEQTSAKLQSIVDALNGLQLQLDYQRDAIIAAIGGEPALLDTTADQTFLGKIDAPTIETDHLMVVDGGLLQVDHDAQISDRLNVFGSLKVGTGPDITGATAQIDGALVVGDGAGGIGGSIRAGKIGTNYITLTDDSYALIAPPSYGMFIAWSAGSGRYAILHYRLSAIVADVIAIGGSTVVYTTPLFGTTGNDGSVNIGIDTTGIYVENRQGYNSTISYVFLGV